jgi:ribonuclease R
MDVEREIVDLYRTLLMRDKIGMAAEGTVTALVGSGAFVALDEPFVEVLVRFESMGPDHYGLAEDELSIVGSRSGDTISLGDRMAVVIDDVAVMRRTVYARRVVPEALLEKLGEEPIADAPPRRAAGFMRRDSRRGEPARFVEKNRDARRPGDRPRKPPGRGATLPVSGARPPARPQNARPQNARPQKPNRKKRRGR